MARDEDDDEDELPRKKVARESDDAGVKAKPMPMRLVGAIIAAMAWGILTVYFGCLHSSSGVLQEIHFQKMQREQEEHLRKMQEAFKGMNAPKIDFGGNFGRGNGLRYTLLGTKVFFMLASVLLLAGGVVLLMRKGFGKYLAMGAPVAMILVEFMGFAVCLFLSDWRFLEQYNVDFFINITFSLVVGGCIVFLLLDKDVNKALR